VPVTMELKSLLSFAALGLSMVEGRKVGYEQWGNTAFLSGQTRQALTRGNGVASNPSVTRILTYHNRLIRICGGSWCHRKAIEKDQSWF